MDLSVEEFCVQAAGRIKGNLTFQGYPVRLNPKLSVCRQLHNRWLDATGRDVSYEEFKRSLRFSMKNGQVEVRMAYDPTKFVLAGLAGVGATAAAVGGYQWWKSQMGKKEQVKCVQPDYSSWAIADALKFSKIMDEFKQAEYIMLTRIDTLTQSNVQIRSLSQEGTQFTSDDLDLIEGKWRKIPDFPSMFARIPKDVEDYTWAGTELKECDYRKGDPHLTIPAYRDTSEVIDFSTFTQSEPDSTDVIEIEVDISDNPNICEQCKISLEKGTTRIIGSQKGTDLFHYKTLLTSTYKMKSGGTHLSFKFENPNNIEGIKFTYCDVLNVEGIDYKMTTVGFASDDVMAFRSDGPWILVIKHKPEQEGAISKEKEPPVKLYEIPDDNLSNVCMTPTGVAFCKLKQ